MNNFREAQSHFFHIARVLFERGCKVRIPFDSSSVWGRANRRSAIPPSPLYFCVDMQREYSV